MGKFLLGGAAALLPLATPEFYTLSGRLRGSTIEGTRSGTVPVAGRISNLAVYVDGGGTGRTVNSRINGADGTLNPTITDSIAGIYRDNNPAHVDPIAANDVVDIKNNWTASTTTYYWQAMTWEATSGHVGLYNRSGVVVLSAGTNSFTPLEGDGTSATEADVEQLVRVAGTRKFTNVFVTSSTLSVNATVVTRLNAADGGMTFVIATGSGAGLFTDGGTGSDTLAAGDKICTKMSAPAGSGSIISDFAQGIITASSGIASDNFSHARIARAASATTHFFPPLSSFTVTTATSEVERQVQPGFPCIIENFGVRFSANTYTGSATVTFRKNGIDIVTLTVATLSTAVVEDLLASMFLNSTDLLSISVTGGTSGSATIAYFRFTLRMFMPPFNKPVLQALNRAGTY